MSFRICATVLIDFNGNAVQSYSFRTRRVLGDLRKVLEFLDAYEVDEIHAIVPIKGEYSKCSNKIFNELSSVSISTPLSIGGGIVKDSIGKIMQDPFFERCIFNRAIFSDHQLIHMVKSIMGKQSMVALLPFVVNDDSIKVYNSKKNSNQVVGDNFWNKINDLFNEVVLLDCISEGGKNGFNFEVLEYVEFPIDRVLISGGITKDDIKRAKEIGLAGVSIDNFTLHSEYSIKDLR